MKDTVKKYSAAAADLVPLILFLICTIIVAVTCAHHGVSYDPEIVDMSEGWVTSDGKIVSLSHLPKGDLVLEHSLEGIEKDRKRLCFKSTHTNIKAEFDGILEYDYAPELTSLIGRSYGMYIHMIPVPEDASKVTLILHPLYDEIPVSIKEAALEDAGMFMGDLYHSGLPDFELCMIIALFGILMLIMGFPSLLSTKNNYINFFSLGVFAILVGIWSMNDTMILQVFTQHPEIARFVNYICLIFIAYPPVSFIASATNQRRTKLLPLLMALTLINFVSTIVVSLLRLGDIRSMLLFSHINIAIAMVITVYLMVSAKKKKTVNSEFLRTVVLSISPAVVGVGMDLIRFRAFPESPFGASLFTKVGVIIFITLMTLHLIHDRIRLAVEEGQAELVKKLAFTDVLTDLPNRAAFHKKEEELRNGKSGCVIVQLDINYLKTVNDEYGHAEGDRHIKAAAHIIHTSFENIGTSYRTGGDEFISVIQNGGIPETEKALSKLEKSVEEYNLAEHPPVTLRIAYGYAEYVKANDTLEAAEKLADSRMYEKKKSMKMSKV